MRIGLVLGRFDPRCGGAEQSTVQYALGLARRGHEVHVVAKSFGPQAHGVPIVAHPTGEVRSRIAFAEAAEATLRSLSLDVVHDMGWGWYCDVFQPRGGSWMALSEQKLLLLPRWLRPGKRLFDRLTPRHRQFARLLERQCADDGRLVVAMSRMTAEHFR